MAKAMANGGHACNGDVPIGEGDSDGREDMAGRQVGDTSERKGRRKGREAPPHHHSTFKLQTPNSSKQLQTPTITINNNIRRRRPAALTSRLSLAAAPHPQGNGAASSTFSI